VLRQARTKTKFTFGSCRQVSPEILNGATRREATCRCVAEDYVVSQKAVAWVTASSLGKSETKMSPEA